MLRLTRSQHDNGKTRRTAVHFRVFCRVLLLVLCNNALAVYFLSLSIRKVVVTTLFSWLLLQVAYFGSLLFLIWRDCRAERGAQRTEYCQKVRDQSQEYHKGDK
ncbi:exopolysaccharide production repressor protein (plasmid) [Sinorhizobium terangae]|nr:exopolysaccharide production repressor protein [Sinorhizobium terangae]WFU51701.1 exopolysaccharide production repressor protein [Sinorhizobium terangae]